jgi:transcriptional regulator, LysR family
MKNSDPNWFLRARLKTRQLLLLIALDDTRNIHRAASELNMTQPAASKQLKDLEDMLGVSLFERLPRGMRPTIYGEAMIRHARMALTSLSKAHEDIVALKSGLSGQVDVGVILSPGMALLPPAIARVKEQAPMLRIGVEVESSNILLSRLLHGELDFIIGRILDEEARGGLLYEELADEPVCAVARVGHPFHTRTDLTLADLAGEAWIMAPRAASCARAATRCSASKAWRRPPTWSTPPPSCSSRACCSRPISSTPCPPKWRATTPRPA